MDLWYTVKCSTVIEGKTIKIETTAKDSHFALYEVKAVESLPEPTMLEDCTTAKSVSLTEEKTIKFEDGKCLGIMKDTNNIQVQECDDEDIAKWDITYTSAGLIKIKSTKHPKFLYAEKVGKRINNDEWELGFKLSYGVQSLRFDDY